MKMTAKTKISKAVEFLRKAVRALRVKASVLRARLLFLASLRRRTAMVGAISRHIHAPMPGRRQGEAVGNRGKVLAPAADSVDDEQVPPAALHGIDAAGLSELLQEVVVDDDDDGDGRGYPDWTHTLFDDDDGIVDGDSDNEEEERNVTGEVVEEEEEPSVMEVIRRWREGEGVEFKTEEEIDHAADIFIRRVRSRINNRSF